MHLSTARDVLLPQAVLPALLLAVRGPVLFPQLLSDVPLSFVNHCAADGPRACARGLSLAPARSIPALQGLARPTLKRRLHHFVLQFTRECLSNMGIQFHLDLP